MKLSLTPQDKTDRKSLSRGCFRRIFVPKRERRKLHNEDIINTYKMLVQKPEHKGRKLPQRRYNDNIEVDSK